MKETVFFVLLLAQSLLAADVTGKWRADSTFPRGDKVTEYLELTGDTTRVRGKFIDAFGGKHEIRDGKLNGDRISFSIPWEKDKCEVSGTLRDRALVLKLVTPQATRSITAQRSGER